MSCKGSNFNSCRNFNLGRPISKNCEKDIQISIDCNGSSTRNTIISEYRETALSEVAFDRVSKIIPSIVDNCIEIYGTLDFGLDNDVRTIPKGDFDIDVFLQFSSLLTLTNTSGFGHGTLFLTVGNIETFADAIIQVQSFTFIPAEGGYIVKLIVRWDFQNNVSRKLEALLSYNVKFLF